MAAVSRDAAPPQNWHQPSLRPAPHCPPGSACWLLHSLRNRSRKAERCCSCGVRGAAVTDSPAPLLTRLESEAAPPSLSASTAPVSRFFILICSVGSSAPSNSQTWEKVIESAAVLRAASMKTWRHGAVAAAQMLKCEVDDHHESCEVCLILLL